MRGLLLFFATRLRLYWRGFLSILALRGSLASRFFCVEVLFNRSLCLDSDEKPDKSESNWAGRRSERLVGEAGIIVSHNYSTSPFLISPLYRCAIKVDGVSCLPTGRGACQGRPLILLRVAGGPQNEKGLLFRSPITIRFSGAAL